MKLNLSKIVAYLKEPYPYYYNSQQRLFILLLLLSFLSFCFSYFFEPFEVNVTEHKIKSIYIVLIHAFIPLPLAYVYFYILNLNIKNDTKWTLGKEIISLSIILLLIGIVDFLIRDLIYTNPDNWSVQYFWEEIRNTFLVGFLLLTLVLPLNLERLINKHNSSLKKLVPIKAEESNSALFFVKNAISNEKVELAIKDFLFAKVEGNYTEVFTSSVEGIHKTLIRITLKELEEQLLPLSVVYKTHRSYLIHLSAIASISGNAQGYQLAIKNCSHTVPVSRSHIKGFNTAYSKL